MTQKAVVLYHGGCQDGLAAAFVAKSSLEASGVKVKCLPVAYTGKLPGENTFTGVDVYVVDYCGDEQTMRWLARLARNVIVLDHHESSKDVFNLLSSQGVITGLWDDKRSGAGLSWDYFHHDQPRPPLIDYVEDRDTNRLELPYSADVYLAISSYPLTLDTFGKLMETPIGELINDGKVLMRKRTMDLATIIRTGQLRLILGDYNVPIVNAPYEMANELGALLCDSESFSAVFCYWVNGIKFSLRSHGEYGADVNKIAQQFGGGGHIHAAGFVIPHNALKFKDGLVYIVEGKVKQVKAA